MQRQRDGNHGIKSINKMIFKLSNFKRSHDTDLSPSRLDHELSGQMSGRLSLQGSYQNTLVKWVSRNYLPVMEDGQAECLTLCMCPQIRLKTKRIDSRNERLDCVERGTWHWCILGNMTSVNKKFSLWWYFVIMISMY